MNNDMLNSDLEVLKMSSAIVLNYGEGASTSMPVNSFCITDLINTSYPQYMRGVSGSEDVSDVMVEFCAYVVKNGEIVVNPEYRIYMPLSEFINLFLSGIGQKNKENFNELAGGDPYHSNLNQVMAMVQAVLCDEKYINVGKLGEHNVSLDSLGATYVRVDPNTNETEVLGDNYSVSLYDLGNAFKKVLEKTPTNEEENQIHGRSR